MRLFISIPLPEKIKKELAKVRENFTEFPAKWVEEENLHITLVFIGEVGERGEISAIGDLLGDVRHRPINLETDGLSLLPNEKKAHILAVKLTGETEKLSTLAEEIKKGLREQKINFDEKPFHPHITLARLPGGYGGPTRLKLKERICSYELPKLKFEARQIELVESKLTPVGPAYQTLEITQLA